MKFTYSFEVVDSTRWISTEADGARKESEHGKAKMISGLLRVDFIAKRSGFDHQRLYYFLYIAAFQFTVACEELQV